MKLSEMSTDKLFDVLAAITPEIGLITSDKEFSEVFKTSRGKKETQVEYGMRRIIGIMPFLLEKYRQAVYKIIAAMNGKTIEEIAAQPGALTLKEIIELLQDKELKAFFQ